MSKVKSKTAKTSKTHNLPHTNSYFISINLITMCNVPNLVNGKFITYQNAHQVSKFEV